MLVRVPGEGRKEGDVCSVLVVLLLFRELQPTSWEAEAVAAQVLSLKNGLEIALIDVV